MHERTERHSVSGKAGAKAPAVRRADAPAPGLPRDLRALQGTAGNAAVTAMLSSASVPVQREPEGPRSTEAPKATEDSRAAEEPKATEDLKTSAGRVKDTVGPAGQGVGAATAVAAGTTAATVGGLFGSTAGAVSAGMNIGINARTMRDARETLAGGDGAVEGTVTRRGATRDLASARAEVGQGSVALVGGVTSATGGTLNAVGNAASSAVSSAGGTVALPGSIVQTARHIRKADKARARVKAVRALMAAQEQEPQKALAAAEREVSLCTGLVDEIDGLLADMNAAYEADVHALAADRPTSEPTDADLAPLAELRLKIKAVEQEREAAARLLDEATTRQQQREQARAAMDRALADLAQEVNQHKPEAPQEISLATIQAYALYKNQRGVIKKVSAAIGGALGTAGAVSALVASIALAAGAAAGAGVLMATPVGWGLAGAAALAALSLASYKAWKFFAKRWAKTTGPDAEGNPSRSTLKRIGKAAAFWKKLGPSKREEYADALYAMAKGEPDGAAARDEDDGADAAHVRTQEARKLIGALGLDWDGMRMDSQPEAAKKLIAAKFAS